MQMFVRLCLIVLIAAPAAIAEEFDPTIHGFFGASAEQVREMLAEAEARAAAQRYGPVLVRPSHPEACIRQAVAARLKVRASGAQESPRILYSSEMGRSEFDVYQSAFRRIHKRAAVRVNSLFDAKGHAIYLSDDPADYAGGRSMDAVLAGEYASYYRHRDKLSSAASASAVLSDWFEAFFVLGKANPCAWPS